MKKSFEEVYLDIRTSSESVLNKAKTEKNKRIFTTIALSIIINIIIAILDTDVVFLAGTIAVAALVILIVINKEYFKFRKLYKELVIKEMVRQYDERLDYNSEVGLSKNDYSQSHFDNSFDEMSSEDRIYGTIGKNTNFQMAQVITKEIQRTIDADGKEQIERIETFNGLYGIVKLEKDSNVKIHIANNSIAKKYSSKRVEMDSAEFEKQYDCLTEDRIMAMKIFTSDLLEKFVNLKKEKISNFEVKIENDMLYFRYISGEFFEPPKIKELLDKELMKKYFGIIAFPVELVEKIVENINEL